MDLDLAQLSTVPADSTSNDAETLRLGLSLDSKLVAKLPPANFTATGTLHTAPSQLLLLEGSGGFRPVAGQGTNWVLGVNGSNQAGPVISLAPGCVLHLRHLTLSRTSLDPATWVPGHVSLPPRDPWGSALVVEDAVVLVAACAQLAQLQRALCGLVTSGGQQAEGEVEAGYVWVHRLVAPTANVTLLDVLVVCEGGPSPQQLRLARDAAHTVSPAHAPGAPPLPAPLVAGGLVALDGSGRLAGGGGAAPTPPAGAPPPACAVRRVANMPQLARAVVELQAAGAGSVTVQLLANMSVGGEGGADVLGGWPGGGGGAPDAAPAAPVSAHTALHVYTNLTLTGGGGPGGYGGGSHLRDDWVWGNLMGRPGAGPQARPCVELDFGLHRFLLWLQGNTSTVTFQGLTLANLPRGPDSVFPISLILTSMWPLAYTRLLSGPASRRVVLSNVTLMVPEDLVSYTAYWTGISASPVGSVRGTGSWNGSMVNGTLAVSPDGSSLAMARVDNLQSAWRNLTLTSAPCHAPPLMPSSGLMQMVPGAPLTSAGKVSGAGSAAELLRYLQDPPTPYVVLTANISLARADLAAVLLAGNATEDASTGRPAMITVTAPVTIIGAWDRPTLLDLGGEAALLQLSLPPGQQVSLKRLTLAGLAPALDWQTLPQYVNTTLNDLWAFEFPRGRNSLYLENVSLLVPPREAAAMLLVRDPANTSLLLDPAPAPLDLLPDGATWLRAWAAVQQLGDARVPAAPNIRLHRRLQED